MIAEGFYAELSKLAALLPKLPKNGKPVIPTQKDMLKMQGQVPSARTKINPNGVRIKSAPGMGRKVTGSVGPVVRSRAMNPVSQQNAVTRAIGSVKAMAGGTVQGVKLAEEKWTVEKVLKLAKKYGVSIDKDDLKGKDAEELAEVANSIKRKAQVKSKKTKLSKPKSKSADSDIVRAANRKKMLLGVKREKAILNVDIMKRINKKNRLATRPFKGLKKQQREARLNLTHGVRRTAKKGYGRS